jgi:hypothetical protein
MKFEQLLVEAILSGKGLDELEKMMDEKAEEIMNQTRYAVEIDEEYEVLTVKALVGLAIYTTTVPLATIESIEFGDEEMTVTTEMNDELLIEGPADELIELATEISFHVFKAKGLI